MFPVKVGDSCTYIRNVAGPNPSDPHTRQKLTAIMMGYDPLPPGASEEEVPTAHLCVLHTDRLHLFRDANWIGAFEKVDKVPYEPEGDYYHGWTRTESALLDDLQEINGALIRSRDGNTRLSQEVSELQQTNTILNEQIAQLKASQPQANYENQLNAIGGKNPPNVVNMPPATSAAAEGVATEGSGVLASGEEPDPPDTA